jgi:hypothetical protein
VPEPLLPGHRDYGTYAVPLSFVVDNDVAFLTGYHPPCTSTTEQALLAQLVEHLHGKEGVDGSSPSEGFSKTAAQRRFLVQSDLLFVERAVGMEPFMELSRTRRRLRLVASGLSRYHLSALSRLSSVVLSRT